MLLTSSSANARFHYRLVWYGFILVSEAIPNVHEFLHVIAKDRSIIFLGTRLHFLFAIFKMSGLWNSPNHFHSLTVDLKLIISIFCILLIEFLLLFLRKSSPVESKHSTSVSVKQISNNSVPKEKILQNIEKSNIGQVYSLRLKQFIARINVFEC